MKNNGNNHISDFQEKDDMKKIISNLEKAINYYQNKASELLVEFVDGNIKLKLTKKTIKDIQSELEYAVSILNYENISKEDRNKIEEIIQAEKEFLLIIKDIEDNTIKALEEDVIKNSKIKNTSSVNEEFSYRNKSKKNRTVWLIVITTIFIGIIIWFSGNRKIKNEYQQAKKMNSKVGYENFITKNYKSKYVDSAFIKIQTIELKEAKTIKDIEVFLEKYPENKIKDLVNSTLTSIREQETAKLKEKYLQTIKFIKRKSNTGFTYRGTKFNVDLNISNCYLTIKMEYENQFDSWKVSLSKLNPNNIKITKGNWDNYYVELKTTGGSKSVQYAFSNSPRYTNTVYCGFQNIDDAQRVGKAFEWLIEYCGGEGEMYEPSKENQSSPNNNSTYNPCDDFSYEELSRTEPMDIGGWHATSIYIRTNNGKEIFIDQIVFDNGTTYYKNKISNKKFGSIFNAARNAAGCN